MPHLRRLLVMLRGRIKLLDEISIRQSIIAIAQDRESALLKDKRRTEESIAALKGKGELAAMRARIEGRNDLSETIRKAHVQRLLVQRARQELQVLRVRRSVLTDSKARAELQSQITHRVQMLGLLQKQVPLLQLQARIAPQEQSRAQAKARIERHLAELKKRNAIEVLRLQADQGTDTGGTQRRIEEARVQLELAQKEIDALRAKAALTTDPSVLAARNHELQHKLNMLALGRGRDRAAAEAGCHRGRAPYGDGCVRGVGSTEGTEPLPADRAEPLLCLPGVHRWYRQHDRQRLQRHRHRLGRSRQRGG